MLAARDAWLAADEKDRASEGPSVIATCGEAAGELCERLIDIGLPISEPTVPCSHLERSVARLETFGPNVPPALQSLWEHVGRLSLVDEQGYSHVEFWASQGVRFRRDLGEVGADVTDGVVIEAPSHDDWIDRTIDELAIQAEQGYPPGYEISADGFHKDNISGGAPYLLVATDDPWLAWLDDFRWWGAERPASAPPGNAPDLVSYLRSALLEAAGFPGLLGDPAFEAIRPGLVEGLPTF